MAYVMGVSRCYWCAGVVHNECRDAASTCNFGSLRNIKLPPYAIRRFTNPDLSVTWKVNSRYTIKALRCSYLYSLLPFLQ